MKPIDIILEENNTIYEYIVSRKILEQYRKAKSMLVGGLPQKFAFKV